MSKVVVFDLSGVFFNDGLKEAVQKISRKYGLNPKMIEFVLNGPFAKKYRTGRMKPNDFWKNVRERLNIRETKTVRKIFFNSYRPRADTTKLIKKLRKQKIKVAFLSNSPEDRAQYLNKKFGFLALFNFGVFSFQAHAWKPEKKIYKYFLKKFKLKAREIIYIDDRERDLKPAKELGMEVILFKSPKQVEKRISKLLEN